MLRAAINFSAARNCTVEINGHRIRAKTEREMTDYKGYLSNYVAFGGFCVCAPLARLAGDITLRLIAAPIEPHIQV